MKKLFIFTVMTALLIGVAFTAEVRAQDLKTGQDQEETEFVPTTFRNLSKLYWAIGKLSLNDNQAIDNYMRINECAIYLDYYQNEFEWRRIREAARQAIKLQIEQDEFPEHFEVIREIQLGKYNMEDEYFELKPGSKMNSITRIDVITNTIGPICGRRGEIENYPLNIILTLTPPMELTKLPVPPELARLYLDKILREYEGLPDRLKKQYKDARRAYVRLKVKIMQFRETQRVGPVTSDAGLMRAVVLGHLQGFEVYADRELTMPLYTKKVEFKRARRYKHRSATGESDTESESPATEEQSSYNE